MKKEKNPYNFIGKSTLTKEEQIISDYFNSDVPKDISNKSFIKDIELGYYDKTLDTSLYNDINEIFREKKHKNYDEPYCTPEYRDILIFKKHNNIVGLSKICFTCQQHYILGTSKIL
jgi:hypothetical protein